MRRSQTVSVTVRLPVGIVSIMNDAVERGLFASSSDFVRAMIIKALPMSSTTVGGGSINGIEIPQMAMEPKMQDSTPTEQEHKEKDTTTEEAEPA